MNDKPTKLQEILGFILKHRTQQEVERITTISQGSVSSIMSGRQKNILFDKSEKLIELYNQVLDEQKIKGVRK